MPMRTVFTGLFRTVLIAETKFMDHYLSCEMSAIEFSKLQWFQFLQLLQNYLQLFPFARYSPAFNFKFDFISS